jgi:hypothetical protein
MSVPKPKSDDKVIHFSRLYELEVVIDMVEYEEPKGYWEVVN